MSFIDAHRNQFGVEPICTVLQVAPSTYYAHKARPPSARAVADERLKSEITRVYKANFEVYGAEKLWRQLAREGIQIGRDHVARLMRALGIRGVVRGGTRRTTTPADPADRPADLVNRQFTAPAPNRLWVADLTYRAHPGGVLLRRVRHRRLQPRHRRLAGGHHPARRPGSGRPGDGHLRAPGRRP